MDEGGAGLDPLVLAALKKLRAITAPDGSVSSGKGAGAAAASTPAAEKNGTKGGNGQRGKAAAR
jgi:hypothetical protein